MHGDHKPKAGMKTAAGSREGQWKVCFKVGTKKCILGVRNEHGYRVYDFKKGKQEEAVIWGRMGKMLKTTPLEREVSLKVKTRLMAEFIQQQKRMGLTNWDVFKENEESINKTITFLNKRLAIYKDRRLKYGLFFLVPHPERAFIIVRSHVKHMPLKQARRRSQEELEKRRLILEKYNCSQREPHASASVTRLMLYTLLSLHLACMIIVC